MALVQSSSRASLEICSSLSLQPCPIQLLTIKDIFFQFYFTAFGFQKYRFFNFHFGYTHTHTLPTYFETVLYAAMMLDAFHHATQFSTLFTFFLQTKVLRKKLYLQLNLLHGRLTDQNLNYRGEVGMLHIQILIAIYLGLSLVNKQASLAVV